MLEGDVSALKIQRQATSPSQAMPLNGALPEKEQVRKFGHSQTFLPISPLVD